MTRGLFKVLIRDACSLYESHWNTELNKHGSDVKFECDYNFKVKTNSITLTLYSKIIRGESQARTDFYVRNTVYPEAIDDQAWARFSHIVLMDILESGIDKMRKDTIEMHRNPKMAIDERNRQHTKNIPVTPGECFNNKEL